MNISFYSMGHTGNFGVPAGISQSSKVNNFNDTKVANVSFGRVQTLTRGTGFLSGFVKSVAGKVSNVVKNTESILINSAKSVRSKTGDVLKNISQKAESAFSVAAKKETAASLNEAPLQVSVSAPKVTAEPRKKYRLRFRSTLNASATRKKEVKPPSKQIEKEELLISDAAFSNHGKRAAVNIALSNGENRLFVLKNNIPAGAVLYSKPIVNFNEGTVKIASLQREEKNYDVVLDARENVTLPNGAITHKSVAIKDLPLSVKKPSNPITISRLNSVIENMRIQEKARQRQEFVNSVRTTVKKITGFFGKLFELPRVAFPN